VIKLGYGKRCCKRSIPIVQFVVTALETPLTDVNSLQISVLSRVIHGIVNRSHARQSQSSAITLGRKHRMSHKSCYQKRWSLRTWDIRCETWWAMSKTLDAELRSWDSDLVWKIAQFECL